MTKITLHGFAPSTYTRTARMAALEKGVEHELVPVAYGTPEHYALHPFGKMPVLTHDDATVFETLAIVSYLDSRFEGPGLFPANPLAQTQTMTMVSVAIDYAYRPVVHTEKTADTFDADQMAAAATVFDWLEISLSARPFAGGTEFGAADIFLAPMLDYHMQEAGSEHVYANRPALKDWFSAVSQRPSFVQTAVD